MFSQLSHSLGLLYILFSALVYAQTISSSDGYTGYSLSITGDEDSVLYETDETSTSDKTIPDPDVFLNATVFVGEIDLLVSNLSAKINLDAQVLSLLQFNAGVDVSIDRVNLLIQNVSAKVELEARLENLVRMINDTLSSIDLNPIIATLGSDVGTLVNDTVSGLDSSQNSNSSALDKRSYDLVHNILYSVNDYSGNTHTNRVLTQSGDIVDQFLHNDGTVYATNTVGSYWHDMTFTGDEHITVFGGVNVKELQYSYTPFNGLSVISAIFVDAQGNVVATQVLSESGGGGGSTIGN